MWVVKQHEMDYDVEFNRVVFSREVSVHETQAEAESECDMQTTCMSSDEGWFSVEEA